MDGILSMLTDASTSCLILKSLCHTNCRVLGHTLESDTLRPTDRRHPRRLPCIIHRLVDVAFIIGHARAASTVVSHRQRRLDKVLEVAVPAVS